MSKGNHTRRKKDELLEIFKEVMGDTETFTVGYSSELVDVTVVINEANQIQNDVPPITWVVVIVYYQWIVEYVKDGFSAPINMDR